MFARHRIGLVVAVLAVSLLGSCVPAVQPPPLTPAHPAHPQAEQAPLPPPSTALITPPLPASGGQEDPHAGHRMSSGSQQESAADPHVGHGMSHGD
jgi:hypothetical protein